MPRSIMLGVIWGVPAAVAGIALGLFAPRVALVVVVGLVPAGGLVLALALAGLRRRLRGVTRAQEALESEIDGLRRDMHDLVRDRERKDDRLVAEVKLLQKLLVKLSEARATVPPPSAAPDVVSDVEIVDAEPVREDAAVIAALRDALAQDRVRLYVQPIVSLPQRQTRFYECFTRVEDKDGAILTPDEFIPVAERAGLIGAVDNMLLFRCMQLVRRTRRRNRDLPFFCNISRHSLLDIDFFNEFLDFLSENQSLADHLVFEFVQADILDPELQDKIRHHLGQLSRLGYRFSLDRVSSLELDLQELSDLGFRFIKLDAAGLLFHLREEPPTLDLEALRQALERVAIDLIVEKIESEDDLRDLLDARIDYGQGYVFGEPRLSRPAQEQE